MPPQMSITYERKKGITPPKQAIPIVNSSIDFNPFILRHITISEMSIYQVILFT